MNRVLYKKYIKVLRGASEVLVGHRELRNEYETNTSLKTWAAYFLLKSLTTSGVIKKWTKQKKGILNFCKMSENCFRTRLRELKELGLIQILKDKSIILESFETAADILGIKYSGFTKIEYNESAPGKQIFQFYLVMDEITKNQEAQRNAINNKMNKNPELKNQLQSIMIQHGAVRQRLKDKRYFQQYLLKTQAYFFIDGSEIWTEVSKVRADINRSVYGIQRQYGYRSAQSVSYLKRKLIDLNVASVWGAKVESDNRARLFIPQHDGGIRPGVKYCQKTKKTVLFFCDAIISKIKISDTEKSEKKS